MLESRIGTGMFDLCFRNGIERQMAQSRAGIEQAHTRGCSQTRAIQELRGNEIWQSIPRRIEIEAMLRDGKLVGVATICHGVDLLGQAKFAPKKWSNVIRLAIAGYEADANHLA